MIEFGKLEYPKHPIPRRVLLWEKNIPGYTCLIYNCPDTPHLIARINGQDYAIRIGSIFKTIIQTVKIDPLKAAKAEGEKNDNISNGPQK